MGGYEAAMVFLGPLELYLPIFLLGFDKDEYANRLEEDEEAINGRTEVNMPR